KISATVLRCTGSDQAQRVALALVERAWRPGPICDGLQPDMRQSPSSWNAPAPLSAPSAFTCLLRWKRCNTPTFHACSKRIALPLLVTVAGGFKCLKSADAARTAIYSSMVGILPSRADAATSPTLAKYASPSPILPAKFRFVALMTAFPLSGP